jgi:hypothetical protein
MINYSLLRIRNDKTLYNYLKFHSYWYIEILKDSSKIDDMIKEMKDELKLNVEDKLEDLRKKMESFSQIMEILS